jgi:hypothetical protein
MVEKISVRMRTHAFSCTMYSFCSRLRMARDSTWYACRNQPQPGRCFLVVAPLSPSPAKKTTSYS